MFADHSFSPLLIGEVHATSSATSRPRTKSPLQSPPHRGSSRVGKLMHEAFAAVFTFSPLLIGEVHAKDGAGASFDASVSQSPPHRGSSREGTKSASGKAVINFQSPPHRGSSREGVMVLLLVTPPGFQSPP